MEERKKTLALFDFDKTITDRDTFFDFMNYACGKKEVAKVFVKLFLQVVLYFAGFLDGGKLKELFFRRLIGGWQVERLEKIAQKYTDDRLKDIVRISALKEISRHRENEADITIVSASPSVWIKPFAKELEIGLIATELEIVDGRITGNLAGKNCRGQEKVERIKKLYDLQKYENIFAYGDSSGDREMLEIANHKYYKVLK